MKNKDIKNIATQQKEISEMIDLLDVMDKIYEGNDIEKNDSCTTNQNNKPTKQKDSRRIFRYISSIAACVAIGFIAVFSIKELQEPKDTFSDPRLAYQEVEKVLHHIAKSSDIVEDNVVEVQNQLKKEIQKAYKNIKL